MPKVKIKEGIQNERIVIPEADTTSVHVDLVVDHRVPGPVRVRIPVEDDVSTVAPVVLRKELLIGEDLDRTVSPVPPLFGIESRLLLQEFVLLGGACGSDHEAHSIPEGILERS